MEKVSIPQKKKRKAPPSAWKKGQSGNPKGAPRKEWRWAEVIREVSQRLGKDGKEWKVSAAESLMKQVFKGNVAAIKELGDRLDGKAQQEIRLTGDKDHPIEITSAVALRARKILKKRQIDLDLE